MASKSSSPNPIVGYRYYMSIQMGIARGPIDALLEIKIGDISAWTGSVSDNTQFDIDRPDLFGGEEKEGGIKGTVDVQVGYQNQTYPNYLKDEMGGGLIPEFRGVTTLFYRGLITVNNPYPKTWKMRVQRRTAGWHGATFWYGEKVSIDLPGPIYAMNPAHIIYECATNPVWGRGLPTSILDDASFRAAADTLYAEGFGICLRWNRQDDLDKFVQSIINHIAAAIYIDRQSGLLTLKLLRADYDINEIPTFNYDTGLIDITDDQSGSTETSFNEIVVKYHDPITDLDGQVRVQNLASFQSLGSIISTTVDYPGLPTPNLAALVAQRDLDVQSPDLRRMTLKFDRRGGVIEPGSVFNLVVPSRGIAFITMRAGNIEDSPLNDGTITVTAIQDVFSLPSTSYLDPEISAWVPPDRTAVEISNRRIEEGNYWDASISLPPATLDTLDVDSGAIKTFAEQPTALSMEYVVDTAAGSEAFVERGIGGWEPVARLTADIDEYATAITFDTQSNTHLIVPSVTALIGDEIVSVDVIDTAAGTATIVRGIIDTIPAPHLDNDYVWFQYALPTGGDGREYVDGETVHVKLLTRTSSAKLSELAAPTDDIVIGGRQGRPYPPGNVRVNGERFAEVTPQTGDVVLTWAHRDRVMQNSVIVGHSAGSTGPEPGTTYTIRIYDGLSLIRTVSGLTGTTYNYDITTAYGDGDLVTPRFELESIRGGKVSWQHYTFDVVRVLTGFDYNFDYDFDGGV